MDDDARVLRFDRHRALRARSLKRSKTNHPTTHLRLVVDPDDVDSRPGRRPAPIGPDDVA